MRDCLNQIETSTGRKMPLPGLDARCLSLTIATTCTNKHRTALSLLPWRCAMVMWSEGNALIAQTGWHGRAGAKG
jgi:hypothetical protein